MYNGKAFRHTNGKETEQTAKTRRYEEYAVYAAEWSDYVSDSG